MAPERDLFANFERMRREIDELFGDVFERPGLAGHRRAGFVPAADVAYAEDPRRVVVQVALPGVRAGEIELEVSGRELVICGERRPDECEGRLYQQVEIEHGPFRRVIELGAEVVAERTRATCEDGILTVELPLASPEQRRRTVPIRDHSQPGRAEVRSRRS